MRKQKNILLGFSIGDFNGIGIELFIKSFMNSALLKQCTPVLFGSTKVVNFYKNKLSLDRFHYTTVDSFEKIQFGKVNIINCWSNDVKICRPM